MTDELRGLLDHMLEALDLEISAVRARGRTRSIQVRRGKHVASKAGRHVYEFELPRDAGSVDATSVAVLASGTTQTGELLDTGSGRAVVAVARDLGRSVSSATLEIDPSAVLEATAGTLMDLLEDDDDGLELGTVAELLGLTAPSSPKLTPEVDLELDPHQRLAVESSLASKLTFVWGPPGTGKTRTLGALATELVRRGKRVLVTAHAHVAVDTALLAALAAGAGAVTRVGVPQLTEVPDSVVVDGWGDIASVTPLGANPDEGAGMLVATTLAKIAVSGPVASDMPALDFDHVLVDEASMVQLPQLVLAAVLAPRLTVFGDFRQLPPIVSSNAPLVREWLGTDVFEVSGVAETVRRQEADERLFMLRRQYRAHPNVAAVCNRFAYGGRLESADGAEGLARLAGCPPLPGAPVVVWDTSTLGAAALRPRTSRCNPTTALLVASAAEQAARKHAALAAGDRLIGIVTPYAEQARLVRLLVDDTDWGEEIDVATVHRFQGGERELVYVDLCDTRPLGPPPFLVGDEGVRLLNVALSRARSKLVVVADLSWLTRGTVAEAIGTAGEEGEHVSAEVWDGLDWHDMAAFLEQVSIDVATAEDVLIRAPRVRDTALVDAAVEAARRGRVHLVTDGEADPATVERCRTAGVGVEVVARVRERIIATDEVAWVGNTVSAAARRAGKAMLRRESPAFATRLRRILGPVED